MLTFSTARNGTPTASAGNVRLNSAYNPEHEAQAFAKRSLSDELPSLVLVCGETLGYITKSLKTILPGVRIVAAYFSQELYDKSTFHLQEEWYPGRTKSFSTFLRQIITDVQISGLKVLFWEPAFRAFPQVADNMKDMLSQFIREKNGNINTTAAFGRRWISNSCMNFLHINTYARWQNPVKPILIAASGPSLGRSLLQIKSHRDRFHLWALPSATMALLHAGLAPELVIITDPGYYSGLHLHSLIGKKGTVVAAPLSAVSGLWKLNLNIALLSQQSFFEKTLLSSASLSYVDLPPRGTVAASALDLAKKSDQCVIFAGLDLASADVHTHVTPHAFDELLDNSRLKTRLGSLYQRAISQRSPMKTYAGWFSESATGSTMPVYRLNASTIAIPGMLDITAKDLAELFDSCGQIVQVSAETSRHIPSKEERKTVVTMALDNWLSILESEKQKIGLSADLVNQNAGIFELLYFTDIRKLLDIYKHQSLGNKAKSKEIFDAALTSAGSFFSDLKNKIYIS